MLLTDILVLAKSKMVILNAPALVETKFFLHITKNNAKNLCSVQREEKRRRKQANKKKVVAMQTLYFIKTKGQE